MNHTKRPAPPLWLVILLIAGLGSTTAALVAYPFF